LSFNYTEITGIKQSNDINQHREQSKMEICRDYWSELEITAGYMLA